MCFKKNNRDVCFYDEEQEIFLGSDMNLFDIKSKTIIPFCYIGTEKEFFDAIKSNGGVIPCGMENISTVEHWANFYTPKRKVQIIKGGDLTNPDILDKVEAEYGDAIFF